jgi:hypothetical protein
MTKVLWTVDMSTAALQAALLADAQAAGATIVCIRSDNATLPAAIAPFHAAGISVWAWRWPAVLPGPHGAPHYYAIDEANYVVGVLMPAGLDGYVADIESDGPGQVNDWDAGAHQPLAANFCNLITGAVAAGAPTCPGPFRFGLTAGCVQPTNNRNIPWATFVAASDTLYPQTYWRAALAGGPTDIHGGTPQSSRAKALTAWGPISGGKPIIGMAGEIDLATPAEIAGYGAITGGQAEQHFYADGPAVTAPILTAIAAL